MDFLSGNHSQGPSNSKNSSESKENMKPSNQKKEDKALINKKRNREIVSENEENIIISGEETNGKHRKFSREMHLSVEREKRKNFNDMFDTLQALLPRLPFKPNKATIVDGAVNYIKDLEQTLAKLEKQRQERPKCVLKEIMATSNTFNGKQLVVFNSTWAASNMVLNIHGDEAQFTICQAHKAGLMTIIAYVLEKHKIETITSSISHNDTGNTCMIQVQGKRASDTNSVEETYRHAAEEIMSWIN